MRIKVVHFLIIAGISCLGERATSSITGVGNNLFISAHNISKIKPDIILEAADFEAVGGRLSHIISKLKA